MSIALVGGLGLVAALGAVFFTRWRAKDPAPPSPHWIDNPDYDKLGAVSSDWLQDRRRQG